MEAIEALGGPAPPAREARVRRLRDPRSGQPLDQALAVWLPGPHSFTGEDSGELHLHGGAATVEAVTAALASIGLRLAEPGEFSRRAFENGKLDLAQAEAIADLVEAETHAQRRQALAQFDGALSRRYEAWRATLIDALAWLEAEIDFPDEELPERLAARAGEPLERLAAELAAALADSRGERVREGFRVALIGAPNAGKSSLLNALVDRDAAIVTAIPGTTRDVIEAPLTIDGYRVLLADTAGVRAAADAIEAEGVRRARAWAEGADLRLLVVDSHDAGPLSQEALALARPDDILVLSKSDLPAATADRVGGVAERIGVRMVGASVVAEGGVDALRAALADRVRAAMAGADFPATTRLRHRAVLEAALDQVRRAIGRLPSGDAELVAEDVRLAARALERLSGRIDAEAVLDRVFASFCIGK